MSSIANVFFNIVLSFSQKQKTYTNTKKLDTKAKAPPIMLLVLLETKASFLRKDSSRLLLQNKIKELYPATDVPAEHKTAYAISKVELAFALEIKLAELPANIIAIIPAMIIPIR